MSETTLDIPPGDDSTAARNCQIQHQYWTAIIVRNEQEIQQLLLFLTELPEQRNPQSPNYQAKYYYSDLIRLKNIFQRLRLDMICDHSLCGSTTPFSCRKAKAGLYTNMAVDAQLRVLDAELARIKARCTQFY
ncbi:hypothetical protein [Spirosoma rigui]|uniref:hypothetical protein n=1 Tax=Spirosoma rigui TaxID=564064 RepID=UPI0009B16710|nr:hypothetical protein [Spirosoma rigui]